MEWWYLILCIVCYRCNIIWLDYTILMYLWNVQYIVYTIPLRERLNLSLLTVHVHKRRINKFSLSMPKVFFWVKKKLLWYCNFNIEWKKNGNKMSALLNFNGYFSFLNSQKIDCSKVWFYIVFLYIFFHFRQTFFFLLTFHRTFPSRYKIKFFFFVETVCRFKLCLWHQSKISLENEGNCQILAC